MKAWWLNLCLRHKRFMVAGGIFIAVFFLYELFFASFMNENASLRDDIQHDQKLLTWMQSADSRIQRMQKLSEKNTTHKNAATLLGLLQKDITQSPFKSNLTQLTQADNNAVQLNFHSVDFDSFIKWLILVLQQEGLTVTQMTVTPNGTIGIVDTALYLS